MSFEVWSKEKIAVLSLNDKEEWFEVLNYKLEEDRDISLQDPFLMEKQQGIKNDYMDYIESCPISDNFYKYYILREKNKIVSVCRINLYQDKYTLEGLQTHHHYYRQGYAMKLLQEMFKSVKSDGILTLFSEARVWNDASNLLQRKLGFIQYGQDEINYLYRKEL